jgi:hypothetical protein
MADFIKLFWRNLHCCRHIVLSFDSGYANRSMNYAKTFCEINPWFQCHKTFSGAIYIAVGILSHLLTQVMTIGA